MQKFIKTLDKETSQADLEKAGTCTFTFCSWEHLKPYLEAMTGQEVKGIRVDDSGIDIILK
jgi:hypothetical protein